MNHRLRYRSFVHKRTDAVWCLLFICQLHGHMVNTNTRNHLDLAIFSRVILYVLGRSYRNPEGSDTGVTEVKTMSLLFAAPLLALHPCLCTRT